jgi:hypothetical protein
MAGAPVGNQNAKTAKRWQSAITRALARAADGKGVEAGLDTLEDKLVGLAAAGEQWAIREVGDRLDGKPAQALIHQGDEDGGPVKVERIERVIRRADVANRNG